MNCPSLVAIDSSVACILEAEGWLDECHGEHAHWHLPSYGTTWVNRHYPAKHKPGFINLVRVRNPTQLWKAPVAVAEAIARFRN